MQNHDGAEDFGGVRVYGQWLFGRRGGMHSVGPSGLLGNRSRGLGESMLINLYRAFRLLSFGGIWPSLSL